MLTELRYQVRDTVRPLAEKCGLSVLSEFADIVVIAWLFFTALQVGISPAISRVVFPVSYGKANKRTRKNWDMHVVSLVHALVAVVLASWCLQAKSLNDDRAFGTYPDASFLLAIAIGYFIWDALESIIHFSEVGFVVHGVSCLVIYVLATATALCALLCGPFSALGSEHHLSQFELTRFLDKMGKTGSQLQFVNGIALLTSFFCVRLVWGGIMSYGFFVTLNGIYTQIPLVYIMVYGMTNLTLHGLNWFWFMKMIDALRRRFAGKSVKDKPSGNGILNGNGTRKIESHLD